LPVIDLYIHNTSKLACISQEYREISAE